MNGYKITIRNHTVMLNSSANDLPTFVGLYTGLDHDTKTTLFSYRLA